MTLGKLEKAKELNQELEKFKYQLEKIDKVTKETKIALSGNSNSFYLPLEIRDTVILLCKATYQSKLEKAIKDFEEL